MQYTITEAESASFQKEGFDIYDDKGNLVSYGAGKTVPYDRYVALLKENEALKKEVATIKEKKTKKKEA